MRLAPTPALGTVLTAQGWKCHGGANGAQSSEARGFRESCWAEESQKGGLCPEPRQLMGKGGRGPWGGGREGAQWWLRRVGVR